MKKIIMVVLLVIISLSSYAKPWRVLSEKEEPVFSGAAFKKSEDNSVAIMTYKNIMYVAYVDSPYSISSSDELVIFITSDKTLQADSEVYIPAAEYEGFVCGVLDDTIIKQIKSLKSKKYHMVIYNVTTNEIFLEDGVFDFTGFNAVYAKAKTEIY